MALLGLIAYGLIVAGLAARDGQLIALALPFVVYLAAGFLGRPHGVMLEAHRSLSAERVGTGMPVQVTVSLTNRGPRLELLAEDAVPAGLEVTDGSARHIVSLEPGATAAWTYTVSGSRGYYQFASVSVRVPDRLGLTSQDLRLPAAAQLFILPPLLRLKNVDIRPRRTRVYSGLVPARLGGHGTEFFGVREYQPGDPQHWLNWHATARHPSVLFSNEFEQERVTDIGIILDGRERANLPVAGRSIFEYSTLAAAAMADAFLAQGNRVGLLVYGQYLNWTLPGYGKVQRERILRVLAQVQPGNSEVFAELGAIPTRLFPAHSQLVLVSPLLPDDANMLLKLRARGYHVLVVSPDPVGFEAASLPASPEVEMGARIVRLERAVMLQRLRRAGIQLANWDTSRPFEQVMQGRMARPLAWLRAVEGSLAPAALRGGRP
jgi:uncharacterized protein (DUF58 family)